MNSPRSSYRGHRFSPEIISYCIWLCFRFSVSYRDIEELMAERGAAKHRQKGTDVEYRAIMQGPMPRASRCAVRSNSRMQEKACKRTVLS
jgi:hypothetical protein